MQDKAERNRIAVNIWTARLIPIALAGVVGYATYVFVALLCVSYLLVKHHNAGAAIPILVIYFLLFILMTASFTRLLHITIYDPPYLPLGPSINRDRKTFREKGKARREEDGIATGEYDPDISSGVTSTDTAELQNDPDSPGLELFYTKDVFTCEMDGKPRFCSQCQNWKPDRAHHCSSSGRCILKMDHFCPWVGGPVGENNFKFFVQFTGYTALYCIHLLVVMAIYIHKQVENENEKINRQFCAILALAAFFGLFTAGMVATSISMAIRNLTQVENLGSRTRIHVLAVLKPPPQDLPSVGPPVSYHEITYPLQLGQRPLCVQYPNPLIRRTAHTSPLSAINQSTQSQEPLDGTSIESSQGVPYNAASYITPSAPISGQTEDHPREQIQLTNSAMDQTDLSRSEKALEAFLARDLTASRTFAILQMAQGDNPWDLGSGLLNLQELMGTSILDWLLPIKRSPCCNHENPESHFLVGPNVDMLKASVSLLETRKSQRGRGGRRSRRNPYLVDGDTQHGPDENYGRRGRRRKSHRWKRERDGTAFTSYPPEMQGGTSQQMDDLTRNSPQAQA